MKPTFTIGVFGIIRDDQDRVLLVLRNDYDLWNLPGGGLEKGESPWEGVIREVKEETGLDIQVTRLAGVYSKTDKDEIVFSFECKVAGGQITLNDEVKDIQYFALGDIPKNTSPKQVERIKDLFLLRNTPGVSPRDDEYPESFRPCRIQGIWNTRSNRTACITANTTLSFRPSIVEQSSTMECLPILRINSLK
ncbi:MAG: NUDIX hydrolase [bacterium]|nr:NUDIX hydrolase [bacterium]